MHASKGEWYLGAGKNRQQGQPQYGHPGQRGTRWRDTDDQGECVSTMSGQFVQALPLPSTPGGSLSNAARGTMVPPTLTTSFRENHGSFCCHKEAHSLDFVQISEIPRFAAAQQFEAVRQSRGCISTLHPRDSGDAPLPCISRSIHEAVVTSYPPLSSAHITPSRYQ